MTTRATALLLCSLATAAACGSDVRDESGTGGGAASGPAGGPSAGVTTGSGGAPGTTSSSSASSGSVSSGPSSSTATGPGGGPSFAACGQPGSCVLVEKDCCGPCGDPDVDDFDAVNTRAVGAHRDAVCPDPEGTPCPGCAPEPDPNLFAYCDVAAGRCVGADLPRTELAACDVWSDCTLRAGVGCCAGCGEPSEGSWGWVALRVDATDDLAALLCEPGQGCPECAAVPPEQLFADCIDAVCTIVVLEGAPP